MSAEHHANIHKFALPMRCRTFLTELKLESHLPPKMQLWLAASLFVAVLYVLRTLIENIAPQDHLAISTVLCLLLTQTWLSFEKTSLKISLPDNRCWLRHHQPGKYNERSLPVSQIHSARLQYQEFSCPDEPAHARITLVTSLGMIPVNEQYQRNPAQLQDACQKINGLLQSQTRFFCA
jgi:hypothetical protein